MISAAVRTYGTPCYVYDETLLRRNIARFTELTYPHRSVHFASMANNNPDLLRLVRDAGLGVFVNSVRHLRLALACGFTPDEIIYTSTGVRREDLELVAHLGVTINLDSVSQLRLFGEVAPGSSCGVRLNIDENSLGNVFIGAESRIGVLQHEFDDIRAVADKYRLTITGTHVYLGTNIVSLDTMMAGVQRTLDLSDAFPDLTYVDLGGGFPVTDDGAEDFDYAEYDRRISDLFARYSARRGRDIRMVLEPGRALFGDTAVFCTSVLDVKERPDRFLACVDASATLMPRSLFYGDFHRVDLLAAEGRPDSDRPTDVVGSTTYSRDFLARGTQLPRLAVDDVLVFANAGSYSFSMITQFLGQDAPCEVLVGGDGDLRLIRARGGEGQ
ncbi:diaminopimelate decarboxylase [Streptoalloteichus tenebrarius]|uniref:Diaminopimelate decarboxylase n=1 Tax=Streptoalloteichus tenebrarius (strain ATCC 17920 / DSM 40477 / JCM 4838 / CBS 697.72 / NBRC 16177 / NCIMB 11028 / NRRL B-12390 / A12253. 1 / ISP 5477) TaxID=1933 RepID=A0ABT1HUZ0_STRSD|nr:diaminopimelate decarboxylase [Streptoalloteichus tenebrarius]